MGRSRVISLLLLLALFGLPGLPGAGADATTAGACASACGKKCCCRPAKGAGGCVMRGSCCTQLPSDSATTPAPKGQPTARAALAAPVRSAQAVLGREADARLHALPAPPDPPPRSAC